MLMHWLLIEPGTDWTAEATAFQTHLRECQTKRQWEKRLSFGCHQARLEWTKQSGWVAPARAVILAAINNAIDTLQESEK
jgi:hypothetical protein